MVKDRAAPDVGGDWPAIEYERRPWTPDPGLATSRTQQRRHTGPYESAIVPRIAERRVALVSDVAAEAEDASVAISRFDAYVSAHLGTGRERHASELGPMESILLRTESASSSQIENLTVGARQVALAELGEHAATNARIVASNGSAMRAALDLSGRIDADTTLAVQRTLLEGSDPNNAGRWRHQQVWIGGSGVGPHSAQFVPPHAERVAPAMADLFAFIEREDIPVLAHAAIAHAQFETIHPFTDGNGRTGRALLHAMLRAKGVTERLTVPVSAGLLTEVDGYFEALDDYRAGDPTSIVVQLSRASLTAIENGRRLVDELVAIRADWEARITARSDAAVWLLVDALVRHPVVNNVLVRDEVGVSDVAAQTAINQLVEIGALTPADKRARNRIWQCDDVLAALDDFAARARRRRPN